MRIRTTRIPFSEIVGPDAPEITFEEDDYIVLRSLYAYPVAEVRELLTSIARLNDESETGIVDGILGGLRRKCIVEWHLTGPDGNLIDVPETAEQYDKLPGALRSALIPYLAGFRGKPDPTPAV